MHFIASSDKNCADERELKNMVNELLGIQYNIAKANRTDRIGIGLSHIPNGAYGIPTQLLGCCRTAINHIRTWQGPDFFTESVCIDFRYGVGLFHIRAELCKYLVKGNTDTHRQSQFLAYSAADFFCDLPCASKYCPAFVGRDDAAQRDYLGGWREI